MGSLQFFKTLICQYLLEKHGVTIHEDILPGGDDASDEQRGQDAFDKYYSKEKSVKRPRLPRAYRIRGERFPESRLGFIEGRLSASGILKKVQDYHASLGEVITALLIYSIHEGMNVRDEERPVSVTIPVDLRRYFATSSARNFFNVVHVSHNFSLHGRNFEDVLFRVKESFKTLLAPENIREQLNHFLSLEHALPIKVVPLAVKVPVLKKALWNAEMGASATFSNLGRVIVPAELVPHIRLFSVYSSTKRPYMCICSFGDTFVITFSSPLVSNDMQRCFFRALGNMGLDIEIISNTVELQDTRSPLGF
jgi:hypothetical protein